MSAAEHGRRVAQALRKVPPELREDAVRACVLAISRYSGDYEEALATCIEHVRPDAAGRILVDDVARCLEEAGVDVDVALRLLERKLEEQRFATLADRVECTTSLGLPIGKWPERGVEVDGRRYYYLACRRRREEF